MKKIELTRHANVEGDKNRGWRSDAISVVVDGEIAGYAMTLFIPQDRFEAWYPNKVWDYLRLIDGKKWLPKDPWDPSFDDQEIALRLCLKGKRDGRKNSRSEFIRLVNENYKAKWDRFLMFNLNRPKMDFICVFDGTENIVYTPMRSVLQSPATPSSNFRGSGIGQLLYREMAIWLSEQGLKLHSSTLIDRLAVDAWNRLAIACPEAIEEETRELILQVIAKDEPKFILDGAKLSTWLPDWAEEAHITKEDGVRVELISAHSHLRFR